MGKWISFWIKIGDKMAISCKGDPIGKVGFMMFGAPIILSMIFIPMIIAYQRDKFFPKAEEESIEENEDDWWRNSFGDKY